MTIPELGWPRRTERLELRLPTDEAIDEVLRWRNHPDVTRWLLRTTVDPESFRKAWMASADDPLDHAVFVHFDSVVVGIASLGVQDGLGQREDGEPWRAAEGTLGYTFDPAYAGRGFATEVAGALLDLGFTELGLHRITAGCFAANTASARVMEKLGMRREQYGVRDSWHAELGWIDGCQYGILAEEWDSAR
ncbi:GNAT family N-acetyltransferase [Mumia zhuanghuii]|uniref:GNAT family N-acetyltransferase n=1 Tax=Mumia zhuanghuii TaxID=2585211 RepID=A0A5C4MJ79_9ACTN|nr:GNAT family N-acetyltransferase [Mumia zhuanghuii]TNC45284.1 GNAT family N-acetyltransferase [Mumia zhuanghuii]TNC48225.1 GNAT family N-acetyltransferase [Mumia zhuanghuii]